MKLVDWQTAQWHHFCGEVQRRMLIPTNHQPPHSRKGPAGPVINLLRRFCWRFLGLSEMIAYRNQQLLDLLRQMEVTRPPVCHQTPDTTCYFRENTGDWFIFYEVALANEYRLPSAFTPDDVLIDIGMHIGSFTFAALTRGAGRVYGFEVDRQNFELASRNLQSFGERAQLFCKAVWRSDRAGDELYGYDRYTNVGQTVNTGGGSILGRRGGSRLDSVALDDVITEATDNGRRRIKLMKIDCEGSEYPILLTSRRLHLIDAIHGEYHELVGDGCPAGQIPETARVAGVERYDRHAIVNCLTRAGFRVTIEPKQGANLGLFFAHRAA